MSQLNLNQLKAALAAAPAVNVRIVLPDGRLAPAHFHVTEVGRVQKDFVDCGGRWHASRACVLQAWTGRERDDGHRLEAGKLLKILALAQRLFDDESVPVEIEHDDGVISQFPLTAAALEDGELVLRLASKHTDCLARKRPTAEPDAAGGGCGCGSAEAIAAGQPCCC